MNVAFGVNAMALIFARTETRMFFDHVWPKAQAVLFLEGRLYFHHVCGRRASAAMGQGTNRSARVNTVWRNAIHVAAQESLPSNAEITGG